MMYLGQEVEDLINNIVVVHQDFSDDGYIRFANGFQIAWLRKRVEAGGTLWTAPIYYSDHAMGNWKKPFTRIFSMQCNCHTTQYWSTVSGAGNTSAGTVRVFRPTSGISSVTLYIVAIGRWK